jgi:endogenous inhibitor of DNA gyrase (YacG/DUF329 family)
MSSFILEHCIICDDPIATIQENKHPICPECSLLVKKPKMIKQECPICGRDHQYYDHPNYEGDQPKKDD